MREVLFQTNPDVNGLLCYNDGLRIIRTVKPLSLSKSAGAHRKEIIGKSSSFQLFTLPTETATSNFLSYFPFGEDGYTPCEIKIGELFPDHLEKFKSKE